MNDPDVRPPRSARRKFGVRLSIWVAWLIIVLINLAVRLDLGRPIRDSIPARPLDRCLTQQAVLNFLDGKTITYTRPAGATIGGEGTIMLRKERISSLAIRSGVGWEVLVRFGLEHEGKRHSVEGHFQLGSSDDPSLHYHQWGEFAGEIINSR
jgi:hypothetical protein